MIGTLPRSMEESGGQQNGLKQALSALLDRRLSPLDLLPHGELAEKLIELVLFGGPSVVDAELSHGFQRLRDTLETKDVGDVRVVVFGGGSGLSNLVGGDSRSPSWPRKPFVGLKEVFPLTRSVVCVTDDGGSTGELQKDLPLIALGDLRHVLLSSIQAARLQRRYGLLPAQALRVVAALAALFNHRFTHRPVSVTALLADIAMEAEALPVSMWQALYALVCALFTDPRLQPCLDRSHCLGNLLLAAAVYARIPLGADPANVSCDTETLSTALNAGLSGLADLLGATEQAVLPCTATQARLSVLYSNGVQVIGEYKSGFAQRGYPVERVFTEFCEKPHVFSDVLEAVGEADILIMAPGSLYSSLIPVLQVPGLAEAIRRNKQALKVLVSNLWVQAGETDRSMGDAERKFYVSDLIRAYDRNIPGGTRGLFEQVLCLSLKDVPATVLQNYAMEGKVPIYLDRGEVQRQGFTPIECGIFSKTALAEEGVIQHGPIHLAKVIRTLWAVFDESRPRQQAASPLESVAAAPEWEVAAIQAEAPLRRHRRIRQWLGELVVDLSGCRPGSGTAENIRRMIGEILWRHPDIPLEHLRLVREVACIGQESWRRSQKWDSVFSFYEPDRAVIMIREDQLAGEGSFEIAFLVALGQSLLGNYASDKNMRPLMIDNVPVGKIYHLTLRPLTARVCYFDDRELCHYLQLARMLPDHRTPLRYTRVINGDEGFTPPGMLLGLHYAWYLDNRFASHVEYKMAVMKIAPSDLIPEQVRMLERRRELVRFLREVVFRKRAWTFDPETGSF